MTSPTDHHGDNAGSAGVRSTPGKGVRSRIDHGHGLAHVATVKTLLGTGLTLLVLTVLTVLATRVDFGANINLAIAMVIAVVKATLVVLFFMHLRYDRLFHTVVFVSALAAAALFIGFALMDSGQYQHTNIWEPLAPPAAPIGPRPTS